MADAVDDMIAHATLAGQLLDTEGALARFVSYDTLQDRFLLTLANGASVSLPSHLIEGLRDASPAKRSNVEIAGIGYGLHWPDLDLDLSVPALLAGIFGTRAWVDTQRARLAGRGKSPAKSAAAKVNGAKGGRPRKPARKTP